MSFKDRVKAANVGEASIDNITATAIDDAMKVLDEEGVEVEVDGRQTEDQRRVRRGGRDAKTDVLMVLGLPVLWAVPRRSGC
jgi:hypothetical protein